MSFGTTTVATLSRATAGILRNPKTPRLTGARLSLVEALWVNFGWLP